MLAIVCAANRWESDTLVGIRHWDKQMHRQLVMLPNAQMDTSLWEQGFLDNMGNFHNRQEAWKVAYEAGQIIRRVGGDGSHGGTLYSENLY